MPISPGDLSDFTVGGVLVQPLQNRLLCAERTVQLEPKMMDVLVLLATRAGEVVSKREIDDAVWSDVVVSEGVVTRAIAGLRRALGDDAANPRFIETIPKRGYRLVVATGRAAIRATGTGRSPVDPESPTRLELSDLSVGSWVRGPGFVGREIHMREILDGRRHCLWLLGTRGVGKTSLLKQVEMMTATDPRHIYLPLFWDLQGADSAEGLRETFSEAVADAGDRMSEAGIELPSDNEDVTTSISNLRRRVREVGSRLLLLCDEVEELLDVASESPSILRRLRRAFQSHDDMRTVLAASSRLWELAAQRDHTSPFLHGFTPPLELGVLARDEVDLLLQSAIEAARGRLQLSAADHQSIHDATGGHPALLQMVCDRLVRQPDIDRVLKEVAADRSVASLFEVDHMLLTPWQRKLLAGLAVDPAAADRLVTEGGAAAEGDLLQLERLGFVDREPATDRLRLSIGMLAQWLRSA